MNMFQQEKRIAVIAPGGLVMNVTGRKGYPHRADVNVTLSGNAWNYKARCFAERWIAKEGWGDLVNGLWDCPKEVQELLESV